MTTFFARPWRATRYALCCLCLFSTLLCASTTPAPLTKKLRKAGQLAEIDFHRQASQVFQQLPGLFPESSVNGYWEFRAKGRVSTANKIDRLMRSTKAASIEQALELINDGIGARLALDQVSSCLMDCFAGELAAALRAGRLRLHQIENYHAGSAVPYMSPENIQLLRAASPSHFEVLSGDRAVHDDGYTSLHMDLQLVDGPRFELQLRCAFMQQLTTVSHLYYGMRQGKPVDGECRKNEFIPNIRAEFESLSEEQVAAYDRYIAESFSFVSSYANGNQYDQAPKLPPELSEHPNLSIQQLAHTLKLFRLRDLYEDPGDFAERRRFLYFDSLRHLLSTQPDNVVSSLIGNVVQSGRRRWRNLEIRDKRRRLLEQIDGLNFVDVIVWKEAPYYKHRRRILRRGDPWPEQITLPAYDHSQPLGPAEIAVKEIHYMQDSCDNETAEGTVLGLAKALRSGTVDFARDIPPIEVWRDVTGRVWTLDHRRLAAVELAAVMDSIPVKFVSEAEVLADRFKFTGASDGRSIIVTVAKSPLAYVISKETWSRNRCAPATARIAAF